MEHTSHGHRAMLLIVGYLVLVAIMLLVARSNAPHDLPAGAPRINEVSSFARNAALSCDDVGDITRLQLFINDLDTGLHAVACTDDPAPTASFWLRHQNPPTLSADPDHAVWSVLLGNPFDTIQHGRTLRYDIRLPADGAEGVRHLAPPGARFTFRIFEWWSPVAVAVVLLVWGLLIYLAWHSALLRDAAPAGSPLQSRTFSLAKTQLAWWFAIIFAAFVFLWLVTGEIPSLSGQALALLGISSVTTIASLGISSGRAFSAGQRGVFFHDLLADDHGITVQRFQMLVMTIALGLMFLIHVATRLAMPDFDASLLALLGISAGTYVGLKIPEGEGGAGKGGSTPAPPAPPADAPA